MATAILGINNRVTTNIFVRRYANATPSTVGTSLHLAGAAQVDGDVADSAQRVHTSSILQHRVCTAGDEDTLLVIAGYSVFRSVNGGTSWTVAVTVSNTFGFSAYKSGIHCIHVNGVPTYAFWWVDSTSAIRGAKSTNDGATWVQEGPYAAATFASSFPNRIMDEIVYHGSIFQVLNWQNFTGTSTSHVRWYSPGASAGGSFNGIVESVTGGASFSFVIWDDRLLTVCRTGTRLVISDVSAGSASLLVVVSTSLSDIGATGTGRPAAFVDENNDLIVFTATGSTAAVYHVTPALVVTDISSSVLPPSLTSGVSSNLVFETFLDGEADPANAARYVLSSLGVVGIPITMWRWNGTGSFMSLEDSGGDRAHATGWTNYPAGEYSYTAGQLAVRLVSLTALPGKERRGFKIYSVSGTTVSKIRVWVGSANDEVPATLAVLSNPSAGSLTGGDTVLEGLTADSTTTYTVDVTPIVSVNTRWKVWFEVYE